MGIPDLNCRLLPFVSAIGWGWWWCAARTEPRPGSTGVSCCYRLASLSFPQPRITYHLVPFYLKFISSYRERRVANGIFFYTHMPTSRIRRQSSSGVTRDFENKTWISRDRSNSHSPFFQAGRPASPEDERSSGRSGRPHACGGKVWTCSGWQDITVRLTATTCSQGSRGDLTLSVSPQPEGSALNSTPSITFFAKSWTIGFKM